MEKNKQYNGLSKEEVLKAREKYGVNEIEKKEKESFFVKLLHIFTEPMFLLLIISASIYLLLGEINDGIIMMCSLVFIIAIEFFQEEKTDKALDALNQLSSLNVEVIRDGEIITIDSRDVVVGDIVLLEEGDKIPADGMILECQGLGINESALTGESAIVYKKLKDESENHFKLNMCYSGTDVTNGSAIIKVTSVGCETEYGKIGGAINSIKEEKTLLEKQIKRLIVVCTTISLLFFISVIIVNFINSKDLVLHERIIHSILPGITIAMATIPEEIPVVLTVFLALGAWDLAKRKTLTRNMKAVETLGSVTVLCTDKTGTLTENKMVVKEISTNDKDFLNISALSCPENPYDPMEIAIQNYCFKNKVDKNIYENVFVCEYTFNDKDKMVGQVWNIHNENLLCVKGAFENVLSLCNLSEDEKVDIDKKIKSYSSLGYRVLAIAKKTDLKEIPKKIKDVKLEYVGLIALVDPPRKGVKESIKTCYNAGVRVIMITGDNGETAKGIAKQINLKHNENVITGLELEKMSDDELRERVKDTNIFARVYPNHKMRIVKALQENNEVVAMTGDGVNDAPALKKAEIGIAMGQKGTNVAKEASDMILLDDNFNTIVDAIRNGRNIYNNIKKAISYIIIIHVPIALSALLVPLLKLPSLILPVHVVLLELVIDPTSTIVFQRIRSNKNVMNDKPRRVDDPIISVKETIKCIAQGLSIFIAFFGSYYYLLSNGFQQSYALTFSFTVLILSNIFLVYVIQSREFAIKNFLSDLKDKVILLINSIILVALMLIIYLPVLNKIVGTCSMSLSHLLIAFLIAFIATISFEIFKINKK